MVTIHLLHPAQHLPQSGEYRSCPAIEHLPFIVTVTSSYFRSLYIIPTMLNIIYIFKSDISYCQKLPLEFVEQGKSVFTVNKYSSS